MEKQRMTPEIVYTTRLVKSEDLNHHRTLFAGRTAEWFVEAGFLAAAKWLDPQHIVCLKIHGMYFTQPVHAGHILEFTSKIVYAGRSSLLAYIQVKRSKMDEAFVKGFITFIFVDEHTKPIAHNIEVVPESSEDKALYEEARSLKK